MTSLLLHKCKVVATVDDRQTEIPDADVLIEDGWITGVGTFDNVRVDEVIDCSRYLAVPGFVNTHHHLYQTLTRGFPQSNGRTLFEWLEHLYPIWAGLDEAMIEASTRAGLAELLLSGCTTCADHLYVFPPGSENFVDVQVTAARDVGIRFHATRGSMDLSRRSGGLPPESVVQNRIDILRDSERLVDTYHDPTPGAMIQVALAPCSPFSVTPELMLETAGLARDLKVRLHTHLAETRDEEAFSRSRFGVTPVALMERLGWTAEDVWVAHCVHLGNDDISLFARKGVSVAHCPTSNMLLGSGLAPVPAMLTAGVSVGLGVDGSASNDANDMRQEIKQAVLSGRTRDGAAAISVRQALRLATRGGAACLGREDIGSIEPGKCADLALFDVETLQCAGGQEDLVAAVILGATRPDRVIVGGRSLVRRGQLVESDSEDIVRSQQLASRRLLEKWRSGRVSRTH